MKLNTLLKITVLAGLLQVGVTSHAAASSPSNAEIQQQRTSIAKGYAALQDKINANQKVRVIARFKRNDTTASPQQLAQTSISSIASLEQQGLSFIRKLERLGIAALEVDQAQLDRLLDSGLVENVQEDIADPVALNASIAHIGADVVHTLGYTGAGQSVAILDTGVEFWHPFYTNRLVEQACFSSNTGDADSLCPNGLDTQIGGNAANDCTPTGVIGCDHGTHVTGIASGSAGSLSGVAPASNIVAVQVFSMFDNPSFCRGAPQCVLSYRSDQVAALEWVLNDAATNNIAAVNLSLGGGQHGAHCDNELAEYTQVINDLRAAGIATVIASGNDSFDNAVAFPSCITGAITVGNTVVGTDAINGSSNSANMVDVLAPGTAIYSSDTGGTYSIKTGTSMAAPHVAGAIAVLKSANPSLTVNQIENLLEDNGEAVFDNRTNLTFPRLDVQASVTAVVGSLAPPPTNRPVATITGERSIAVSWNNVTAADYYEIDIKYNNNSWTPAGNYTSTTNSISWSGLSAGDRTYRVRACNSAACSANSANSNTVTLAAPGTPGKPSISASGAQITLTWGSIPQATYFNLQFRDNGGSWQTSSATYTGTGQTWSNGAGVVNRSYRVRACNGLGCSGWSSASNAITTIPKVPGTPSVSVSGSTVTLTYGAAQGASYYRLQFRDGSGAWRNSSATYYGTTQVWNNVSGITDRRYRMRGCNSAGCSDYSGASNPLNVP